MPLYTPPITTPVSIANGGTNNGALATTAGGSVYTDGTKLVNVGAGSSGQYLRSNGASAPTWASVTASSAYNITSQTTTYAAAINDYVLASGASFTITLPTAVGLSGQQIFIQHNGTSLTQLYTLNTTSGQTIGGVASGSYVLATNSETLGLVSDGANWQILSHKTETPFVSAGANTITATTTNPTKATGIVVDRLLWKRSGNIAKVRIEYRQNNTTSAANGSGDYLLGLPFTIDTALLTVYATVEGVNTFVTNNSVGSAIFGSSDSEDVVSGVVVYDSTKVRLMGTGPGTTGVWSSGFQGLALNNNIFAVATFEVPIANWQP